MNTPGMTVQQAFALAALFFALSSASQDDLYTNHHGLASAVAGPDFWILASDTRLAGNSGYDILERYHIQSRLWSTGSSVDDKTAGPDGSINVESSAMTSAESALSLVASYESTTPNSWVASVGCQSDCEHVKRHLRAQLRAARYFGEVPSVPAATAAVALSNLLYTRRGFPYYSSCLVAGFNDNTQGQIYAYDVIGSYEAVATACAGHGQALMQPILDRAFTSPHLTPPAKQVDCSSPEIAVERLLAAYRAVSEREITVGDSIVFCCVQRKAHDKYETRIYTAPLKQH